MPHTAAPTLAQLQDVARAFGVGTDFWGFYGTRQEVSAQTLTAVLAALGVDTSSAGSCFDALVERDLATWRRMLPATVVMREGAATEVAVHVASGDPVRVWIEDEWGTQWPTYSGDRLTPDREIDGVSIAQHQVWLPQELPLGWHVLRAESNGRQAQATLIVVPNRVSTGDELPARTGRERSWGLMTQLYSVRSQRSWGVGDLEDLADLAAIVGPAGADWILVNPLHAAEPTPPMQASPYLPTTRRFFSPLYIRVESIPEVGELGKADRRRIAKLGQLLRENNRDPELVARDAAYASKLEALELVYAVRRSPGRARRFAEFKAWHGEGLADFALWCAVRERVAQDASIWEELTPRCAKADALRVELADRIDFYCWLQWVLDEQLQSVQQTARICGMGVGIVHDLAVGVHPAGADSWVLADVLAQDAEVGAPPDMYNQLGQNWSQPPWHPQRLAEAGYAPFRDMLRTILRHAGGIRVDHVLGLFRLWWVPKGLRADEGAYVYYDHEALVGILCLEAQRAGAVVIGEDLGTFEPWVREYLAARGLLGTSILWFEYADGAPRAPQDYRRGALASVSTHDLPPTAGYLAGEHVHLRDRLGLLSRPVDQEREADEREQQRVLAMAVERGLLPEQPSEQETVEALYRLLAAAPTLMLGVALVDAVGERRIQNQPGTDQEYPNWKIPLADADGAVVLIEELAEHPRAKSLFEAVREALRH